MLIVHPVEIGSLDLNGNALTTLMGLTINEALTLDASGEQLLTGTNDLTLNGALAISNGKLTSASGTVSFGSTASLGKSWINRSAGWRTQR